MQTITKTLLFSLVVLCAGISAHAQSFRAFYTYDANGNRLSDSAIYLQTSTKSAEIPISQITNDSATLADSVNVPKQGWDNPVYGPSLNGFDIKVYPNPTHGVLMVEVSTTGSQQLSASGNVIAVWDLQGRQVINTALLKNTNVVDLSQNGFGTYILKMGINGQTKEYKIIKQ